MKTPENLQKATKETKRETPFRYPLFEHMSREHGLTLLDSEMDDILQVCRAIDATCRLYAPQTEAA